MTPVAKDPSDGFRTQAELDTEISRLEKEMKAAAANLDFERAAAVRDRLKGLRTRSMGFGAASGVR
jgi:excinuclease ABC subunit B